MSHSRENSSAALRLHDELNKRAVETWLDVSNLAPGSEWNLAVTQAIKSATGFVFLIGPPGAGDRWQTYEWQQIVDHEFYLDPAKPLIPVLIGNPDLPGFLKIRQSITLQDSPASFAQAAEEIVKTLGDPAGSVDQEKLELGRKARLKALESFREYSRSLAEDELKHASVRALE